MTPTTITLLLSRIRAISRLAIVALILSGGYSLRADEIADLTAKAEKGDPEAAYQLGRRYADGKDVSKDDAQALRWFTQSAQHDNAGAQVSLGSIYAHGFGVKTDWTESIRWYRKAAFQGDRIALHNLGLDYNYGHGVPQDYALAANFYRLGAEQGQPRCQYNLALLYEEGHGVPEDHLQACVFYSLAAAHDDPIHIFGEVKAKEVVERRDRLAKELTPLQLEEMRQSVKAFEARVAANPRLFGVADMGIARGWYIWHSFNPDTWEAEVSKDTGGETWKTRVLPWASAYRYLNYGVRPDQLLPGERVNIFFSPDEKDRRGYVVLFQDEICQMIGHGHYWQIRKPDPDGGHFSAHAMAGDKVFDPVEHDFVLDPHCAKWKDGKLVEHIHLAENAAVYLTWRQLGEKRIVSLLCDRTSVDVIKKNEAERLDKECTAEGLGGQLQSIDGDTVHLMIFSTHWSQAGHIKDGQTVRLTATGMGFHPEGKAVEATAVLRKNRGKYGSGVTDVLLKLSIPDDAQQIRKWLDGKVVRLIVPAL